MGYTEVCNLILWMYTLKKIHVGGREVAVEITLKPVGNYSEITVKMTGIINMTGIIVVDDNSRLCIAMRV